MPKINVYLSDDLADAVRDAQIPVSAVCQAALERAVREVTAMRATDEVPTDPNPAVGPLSRFTPRAVRSIELAEQIARDVPHNYVGTEHLMVGVIDEGSNLALKVLAALEIEVDDLRAELVGSSGPTTAKGKGPLGLTPLAKEALLASSREAASLGHNYIGGEHLLLGLIATEEGLASKVLRRMGVERLTTRRAVVSAVSGFFHAQQQRPDPVPRPARDDTLQQILERLDAIERRLAG